LFLAALVAASVRGFRSRPTPAHDFALHRLALALLGQNADVPAEYNPRTGEMHSNLGYTQSCYVREKRELVADCPGGMACTASGQCSALGVAPQVIRRDDTN